MNQFDRLVSDCAAQGETLSREHARRGDLRPLLLWYRLGELRLDYAMPGKGWTLAPEQGKGLGIGVPWSQYSKWVREHATRLPILKGDV